MKRLLVSVTVCAASQPSSVAPQQNICKSAGVMPALSVSD